MLKKLNLFLLCILPGFYVLAGDSTFIKVHFLYGSKPKKKYWETESKWFGGKHGGHVGIEIDSNRIIDFVPSGSFHYFSKKDDRNSAFVIHSVESFWEMFGNGKVIVQKTSFVIPISMAQKHKLDSIASNYLDQTPYDYAFFGMRCGAAAHDMLAQIGILKSYSQKKTARKIFYPKKLRKRLFKMAAENNWDIIKVPGTSHRKWEKD